MAVANVLLPHQNPGSKCENMVAFATKIPQISSPAVTMKCNLVKK